MVLTFSGEQLSAYHIYTYIIYVHIYNLKDPSKPNQTKQKEPAICPYLYLPTCAKYIDESVD